MSRFATIKYLPKKNFLIYFFSTYNHKCSQDPVTSAVKPATSLTTASNPTDCATTVASPATSRLLVLSQSLPPPSSATCVETLATSRATVQTAPRAPSATTALSLATSPESVQRTRAEPRLLLHQEEPASMAAPRTPCATSAADQTTLPRTARLALSSATLAVRVATFPRNVLLPLTRSPRLVTTAARLATSRETVFPSTR